MDEKFSEFYTLEELIRTGTGLLNVPGPAEIEALRALCNNPGPAHWIRVQCGAMKVNSGYRSPAVNKKVKGSSKSQHMKGEAVDLVPLKISRDRAFEILAEGVRQGAVVVDQMITYAGEPHMHVSYTTKRANRGQILQCLADGATYVPWAG